MHKFLFALALSAAPLAACAHVPTSPAAAAQLTKADEQVVVTAEQAYKAFRLAVEVGVKADIIHGDRANRLIDYDNNLYNALRALELAYEAGNATDFNAAHDKFNQFLTQANALTGGKD